MTKNKSISRNNKNKCKENISNNNSFKGIIIKDIRTSDGRIQIKIKYMKSAKYLQLLSKMKIIRKITNIKNNSNIFLNNEFDILKQTKTDSIIIIPPLTLLNTHIQNGNNSFNAIIEESRLYNEDNIYNNLMTKLINIIQKCIKRKISYYKKYFFDYLKKNSNISSSQKELLEEMKNNLKNLNNSSISNISNDYIQINDTENINDNSNDSKIKIIRIKKDREKCKRNLFREICDKKENIDDKIFSKDEINIKLNKSDLYEKSELSEDTSENEKMNYSYDYPKKRTFRIRIRKCKIIREIIEPKKKKKNIKDILKEDEEMRKKNKIVYLLTNIFSYNNNCRRIVKNYFNIWRKKNNENKSDILFNESEYNLEGDDATNKIEQNLKYKILKDNLKDEKMDNTEVENECEENENNIIHNSINDDNNGNINVLFENNKNIINLPLKCLCAINNPNRIEINTILDSEESKSIYFDKNELEEKIEYFRTYLLNVYLFRRKKNENDDEKKDT
jgi:hypothetical protein